MSIKKSPQWGLNLSAELCFWCNTKTGRNIIHGHLENDEKAPEIGYRGYTPCKTCEEAMHKGITLIQCSDTPNDNAPLADGLYPTGLWAVVSKAWIHGAFKPEAAEKIINDKAVNLTIELWDKLNIPEITLTPTIAHNLDFIETKV